MASRLVVPFVAVASAGGPYDDLAFAAGVQYGMERVAALAEREHRPWKLVTFIRPPMETQYDLLAMEVGAEMLAEPSFDHPGWVRVHMERPAVDDDDGP